MKFEKPFLLRALTLACVMITAYVLRFTGLGDIPTGPYWDEAAIGYNAYSILETGRDEYGIPYPISFRSFNDYKPPLYIYLTVPAVALFGLNIWSVRLISAVAGLLAVPGTYFLAKELVKLTQMQSKVDTGFTKFRSKISGYAQILYDPLSLIPVLSAFFVAVSPWHIHFSRVAFESNLAVTLNIWASVFFFIGLRSRRYIFISFILFSLGLYSYHSERVFIPIFLFLIGTAFMTTAVAKSREFKAALAIFIVLAVPVIISFMRSESSQRFASTSVFVKRTELLTESVQKYNIDRDNGSVIGMVLNDRRAEWVKVFASGYLAHFSLNWLFLNGDLQRHHALDSGLLYVYTLPFLVVGLVSLWGVFRRLYYFMTGWILISPLAAALTFEVPHAIRSFVVLPAYEMLTAFGAWLTVMFVHRMYRHAGKYGKVVIAEIAVVIFAFGLFEMVRFAELYFRHTNRENSQYWQYGYREVINYIRSVESGYDRIVMNSDLEQPYIFTLFYTKYSPISYLAEGGTHTQAFGKYIFKSLDWNTESPDGRTLYVDTIENSPQPNLKTVSAIDGTPLMAILDKK